MPRRAQRQNISPSHVFETLTNNKAGAGPEFTRRVPTTRVSALAGAFTPCPGPRVSRSAQAASPSPAPRRARPSPPLPPLPARGQLCLHVQPGRRRSAAALSDGRRRSGLVDRRSGPTAGGARSEVSPRSRVAKGRGGGLRRPRGARVGCAGQIASGGTLQGAVRVRRGMSCSVSSSVREQGSESGEGSSFALPPAPFPKRQDFPLGGEKKTTAPKYSAHSSRPRASLRGAGISESTDGDEQGRVFLGNRYKNTRGFCSGGSQPFPSLAAVGTDWVSLFPRPPRCLF